MNWIKINKNTYECETPYWHFFIETNPDGDNILSTTNKFKHKEIKRTLSIEQDVRECFCTAFDLNLMAERKRNWKGINI